MFKMFYKTLWMVYALFLCFIHTSDLEKLDIRELHQPYFLRPNCPCGCTVNGIRYNTNPPQECFSTATISGSSITCPCGCSGFISTSSFVINKSPICVNNDGVRHNGILFPQCKCGCSNVQISSGVTINVNPQDTISNVNCQRNDNTVNQVILQIIQILLKLLSDNPLNRDAFNALSSLQLRTIPSAENVEILESITRELQNDKNVNVNDKVQALVRTLQ